MNKKRVLLGEDKAIIALGFIKILESSALFEVVSHTEISEKIEEKIAISKPDILVINPTMNGVIKGDESVKDFGDIKRVALVHNYVEQNILRQFDGTIEIGDTRQEIENKLKEVLKKENCSDEKANYELSERETDVLIAVAKGMQNKEIADELNISIYTVISHRKNIVAKTGIKSVAGLTVYALINNLISETDVM